MAKVLVQHDTDPGIVVILARLGDTSEWAGDCTQCGTTVSGGPRTSVRIAKDHVDAHEDAR